MSDKVHTEDGTTLKLRCRKTGKAYVVDADKPDPCPYCGAAIHGLDLSRLNNALQKLSRPL